MCAQLQLRSLLTPNLKVTDYVRALEMNYNNNCNKYKPTFFMRLKSLFSFFNDNGDMS